jgi:hypothetical protein
VVKFLDPDKDKDLDPSYDRSFTGYYEWQATKCGVFWSDTKSFC